MTEYNPNYQKLWDTTKLLFGAKLFELNEVCRKIAVFKMIYGDVDVFLGVPWQVVACIHYKEAAQDFTRHLHNGDPLMDRDGRMLKTVKHPAGRPELPPANGVNYTWKESAIDALRYYFKSKGLHLTEFQWSIPATLWFLEGYNGFGYKKRGINTPYLWSGTDHYVSGLYVEEKQPDGTWKTQFHPEKVAHTLGCVPILKRLEYEGR